jgi:hypothetical protein
LANIVERLEPSPRHDTMNRPLVLFTFAIAFGMSGYSLSMSMTVRRISWTNV